MELKFSGLAELAKSLRWLFQSLHRLPAFLFILESKSNTLGERSTTEL